MSKKNIVFFCHVCAIVFFPNIIFANDFLDLYGLFEVKVVNTKNYTNPYDYKNIELKANFTSPTGKIYSYFGFFDGDGLGGLTGNVWKLRFMPDEVGNWTYALSWTDETPGTTGSFNVKEGRLPGPLSIDTDNPWYFKDARGRPFHWRGYSLHPYVRWKYGRGVNSDSAWADLQEKIRTKVAGRCYNPLMFEWPVYTKAGWPPQGNAKGHFWQENGNSVDFSRYYLPQWRHVEKTIETAAKRGVYIFQFVALVDQLTARPNDIQMASFLRYMAARLGPYWNNFGYSATWEYQDIWSHTQANSVMNQLYNNLSALPRPPLLSIHDHSNNLFSSWLGFSMRQRQSRTIFQGNIHGGGIQGGVGTNFLDHPIIGSEDIWEICANGGPCNGAEVRRGAWGLQMAGVLPIYLENTGTLGVFNGQGEDDVRRMFNFFYNRTRYRRYKKLNALVSSAARQIASGIPGQEYLVYDEDGGTITIDLSGTSGTSTFSVFWYDPKSGVYQDGGSISGGAIRSVSSPFLGDSVLLLGGLPFTALDSTPPCSPTGLG